MVNQEKNEGVFFMMKLVETIDSGHCDRCGRDCGTRGESKAYRAYMSEARPDLYQFLCEECAELFAYCNQLEFK